MAYQVNSGKDSHGDEDQFMVEFNARLPEILAYKQQHGGDLEGAFGKVTGTPWPSGRSVKLHNGTPEMTKDRTVKSVLGKYVAPIAAGALTALTAGGAAPALAGLFGGGAPAAAALPAVASGAAPIAAAAPIAGGLASTTIGAGAIPAITGGAGIGAGTGGGILSTVGGFLGKNKDVIGALGKGLGDAATASGQNRVDADERGIRGTAAYEGELNNRAATDAKQRDTAMDDVYRASWYDNRTASPNNSRGVTPMSQQFMDVLHNQAGQGAERLADPSAYNMNTVDPLTPYKPSSPGLLERVGGIAAPIATGIDILTGKKKQPVR